jgi:peptide chain release factor 3
MHRPHFKACWITSDKSEYIIEFIRRKSTNIAYDKEGNTVFLADSPFLLSQAELDYPAITFHTTSDFKLD